MADMKKTVGPGLLALGLVFLAIGLSSKDFRSVLRAVSSTWVSFSRFPVSWPWRWNGNLKRVDTINMTQTPSNHERPFELGLYTFVDSGTHPITGEQKNPAETMRNLMETIELADQTGLDVFAIGEHHRQEYLSSAPVVILAAAAARTKSIRLSTAVTVLSSDDPVRVFQDFATLDLLSNGRSEIMAGRGSFIESFPLFGYDLNDYGGLFDEKLRLLVQLREAEKITWSGRFRAPLDDLGIYPRPVQDELPIWVAVGGTPDSVNRAASLGLPMAFAIIGGTPERYAPYFKLYRRSSKNMASIQCRFRSVSIRMDSSPTIRRMRLTPSIREPRQ